MRIVALLLVVLLAAAQVLASEKRAIHGSTIAVAEGLINNNVPVNIDLGSGPVVVMPTGNEIAIVYEGCYADTQARDLPMQYLNDPMTLQTCAQGCQAMGYHYFGVQYGSQCWCGSNYGSYGEIDESNCNMACSGLSSAMCGGTWANSVYSMQLIYGYQGCYADYAPPNRALPYPLWDSMDSWGNGGYQPGVMIETCAEYCASNDYLWVGLQTGYQCWCGNEVRYQKLDDSACSDDCTGSTPDHPEKCGGSWANSIYQAWTKSNAYKGCWADNSARELPYQAYDSPDNSVEKCVMACKNAGQGFVFAGLQYGSQCWCGYTYGIVGPSNACNMPCAGNSHEICGAAWANSVYIVNGSPNFAL